MAWQPGSIVIVIVVVAVAGCIVGNGDPPVASHAVVHPASFNKLASVVFYPASLNRPASVVVDPGSLIGLASVVVNAAFNNNGLGSNVVNVSSNGGT